MPRVFGGQVAAQALVAAGRTVPEDRRPLPARVLPAHRATPARPIVYTVDRIRDGRSFTTRRVVAVQHGQPIFHLSASFQTYEEGLEHQAPMPAAPDPETLPTGRGDAAALRGPVRRTRASSTGCWRRGPPSTCGTWTLRRTAASASRASRVRRCGSAPNGKLADDPLLHVCLATYVSDMTLLDSVLLAHGRGGWAVGDVVGASLDHAMWFHRPFRADEWLLYDQESPSPRTAAGASARPVSTPRTGGWRSR